MDGLNEDIPLWGSDGANVQNSDIQASAISSYHIENLTFDKASGGAIILGGASNVNGTLTVKDSSGNTRGQWDNTGITIKDGTNTTIIDATGLVSSANFVSGSQADSTTRDITSSTFVDISNTSISTSSFTRTTKVLVITNTQGRLYLPTTDTIQNGEVVLNVDGTNQVNTIFDQTIRDTRMSTGGVFTFDSRSFSLSGSGVLSLGTGIHTLKLKGLVDGQTLRILNTSIIYLILGK